jgi:hypothetical protein
VRVLLHAEQLAPSGSATTCSSAKRSLTCYGRPAAPSVAVSCAA